MLELFVELMDGGKPRIERVWYCYIDGTRYHDKIESMCDVPGSRPVTVRDEAECRSTWDALLAAREAHYRKPSIDPDPVRWFCKPPSKVS